MFVSIYIKATFAPEWCILHANLDGESSWRKSCFFWQTLDIMKNLLMVLINIYCDNLCPSRFLDRLHLTWPPFVIINIEQKTASWLNLKKLYRQSVELRRDVFIYFQGLWRRIFRSCRNEATLTHISGRKLQRAGNK
jgi:hypothetical protein